MAISRDSSVSPFSMSCDYSVKSYPFLARVPGYLTPYEQFVYDLAHSTGAVAFSQVASRSKHKKKLKSLARCGLLALHRLEGLYKLNVLTPGPFPGLIEVLKSLAFTRLVLMLKQKGCVFIDEEPPYRVIILDGKTFHVVIHRETEPVFPVVLQASKPERAIILAEKYHPEFASLESSRILLDTYDLFLYPDGTPEKEPA